MSLKKFRTLGRSGLVVSPIALGTMTFGSGGWGADEATSRLIFDAVATRCRAELNRPANDLLGRIHR